MIFLKQKSHRIDKNKHFFLEISNFWNFFAVLHCVLRTGTQCLENRNTMSWEQEHSVLRTGTKCLENRNTVSWKQEHSVLRTGTQCLENRNTVSWEQEHSFLRTGTTVSWEQEHNVLRTGTQCLENKNTMSWEQEHNVLRTRTQWGKTYRAKTSFDLRNHDFSQKINVRDSPFYQIYFSNFESRIY